MGDVFGKIFRILGLEESKGRWVVELDFHGKHRVNVAWIFVFFYSLLELCSFRYRLKDAGL